MSQLEREVAALVAGLNESAKEVHERGLHTAAQRMRGAANALTNLMECHKGLCEREEKLTAELVALRP